MASKFLQHNLSKNLAAKNYSGSSEVKIPQGKQVKPKKVPQFYSEQFLAYNKIYLTEFQEGNMNYHMLSSNSAFDPAAKSDMLYPYEVGMALSRDVASIVVGAMYTAPKVLAIGYQALARALRYTIDLKANVKAVDSKKNFTEIGAYMADINNCSIDFSVSESYAYLHTELNDYNVIDVEVASNEPPLQQLMPIFESLKEDQLLVYTVKDYINKDRHYKLSDSKFSMLGVFDPSPQDGIEFGSRATVTRMNEIARLFGKQVVPVYIHTTLNAINNVTFYLQLKQGTTELKYKQRCRVCLKEFESSETPCQNKDLCMIGTIGPFYDGSLVNQDILSKLIEHPIIYPNSTLMNIIFKQFTEEQRRFINLPYFFGVSQMKLGYGYGLKDYDMFSVSNWSPHVLSTQAPHDVVMQLIAKIANQEGLQVQHNESIIEDRRNQLLERYYNANVILKPLPEKHYASFYVHFNVFRLPRQLKKEQQKRFGWEM